MAFFFITNTRLENHSEKSSRRFQDFNKISISLKWNSRFHFKISMGIEQYLKIEKNKWMKSLKLFRKLFKNQSNRNEMNPKKIDCARPFRTTIRICQAILCLSFLQENVWRRVWVYFGASMFIRLEILVWKTVMIKLTEISKKKAYEWKSEKIPMPSAI